MLKLLKTLFLFVTEDGHIDIAEKPNNVREHCALHLPPDQAKLIQENQDAKKHAIKNFMRDWLQYLSRQN